MRRYKWLILASGLAAMALVLACSSAEVAPAAPAAPAPAAPAIVAITKSTGETPAKVLARPARAAPAPPTSAEAEAAKYGGTVKWIPNGGVAGVDPIRGGPLSLTTAYSVHDWLVAWDADGNLQPQMLDTWNIEDDGKKITLTLRDGLLFHDLTPVTAADVIQSIHRWRAKATFGNSYFNDVLIGIEEIDDQTIVATFTEPSGVFIQGIGDPSAPSPIMVPKEQAMVSHTEQMTANVGAGVYKLIDIDINNRVIWEPFREYNPRSEPASFRAGGKHAYLDKVIGLEVPEGSDQGRSARHAAGGLPRHHPP